MLLFIDNIYDNNSINRTYSLIVERISFMIFNYKLEFILKIKLNIKLSHQDNKIWEYNKWLELV